MLENSDSWDRYLPLIEFTYNNSFHSSIGMAPYEALYGRKCRTPLCWFEIGENLVLGPDMIQQTTGKSKWLGTNWEQLKVDRKVMLTRKDDLLNFKKVIDHVFLKVTPTTGIGRVMKSKKFTSRFIGPYQILKKIGLIAYQIYLPHSFPTYIMFFMCLN